MFFLPAASHVEKEGTFTQTQRLLQWREKAVEPPGDCRSELWFFYHLGRLVRERLAGSTEPRDRPVLDLAWDYPLHGPHDEPSAEAVLREINGYDVATARRCRASPSCGTTDRPRAAAGSTAACSPAGSTRRPAASPGREQDWVARRVGLGVAGQPPHPLQPRLGRPGGAAVERAQGVRLVGRGGRASGRATTCPTSRRQAADLPPAGGRRAGRRRSPATTRSSCRATARRGCTRRSASSTARCRRTTSRPSRRCATRCTAQQANPTRMVYERPDNADEPEPTGAARRRLPVRLHHQPAHRAPHRRRR